ncbi:MAG: helicase-associated domain-containing protein [Anaerolineae bacterium]
MEDALPELLNGYQYEVLLHIAEFNGLDTYDVQGRKLRKSQLIEKMCKEFFTPERIAQALASLSPEERAVLDRLLLHSGEVDTLLLRAELEQDGLLPPPSPGKPKLSEGALPKYRDKLFKEMIANLTLHGLVFSSNKSLLWPPAAKLDLSPGARLVVPQPVRQHLPPPVLPEVEWGRGSLPAPPEETNTAMAQRELFLYWSIVRTKPLPLTQMGLVQKRALRQLNAQLLFPDPALENASKESDAPRLYFLRLLLQELGLLHDEDYQVRADELGHIPEFWEKPLDERVGACIQAWQQLLEWNELSSVGVAAFDIDLPRARRILLEQLRLLPAETWISAERFLSRLSITTPRLLFKSRERYANGMYYADAKRALDQNRWFAQVEAAFVGGALSGPLHWLGIVDVSIDGDRLLAFRINASGAQALGIETGKAAISAEDAKVIVQPNFEVFALGPVSEAVLARLEMFADRVKADRSAFAYTLSRETVYRGQRYGLSVPQIIAFLEEQSHAPLPQNVLRTLQEWGEQHERIVFHRAVTLCQTASAEMLDSLWNDPAVKTHLERKLTPTVAMVKRGRVAVLRELLLQREMLPALSTNVDSCVGRVEVTPQGELRPIHAGPDLLLQFCLHELAEEREGRFYLSELAVKRALASGMNVQQYLERLAKLHRGPLPGEWQRRIKAWGRYYGKASLRKTVLLEVKDAATAEELLSDKELAPLLSRFAADPSGRFLQVRTEDLEQLRHLLHERGVELS